MNNIKNLQNKMSIKKLSNVLDISTATWYRQQKKNNQGLSGQSSISINPPKGASVKRRYSEKHHQIVLAEMNKPENADYSVREIFAKMLDSGRYLGSISTFYRILRKTGQVIERRNIKRHANYFKPELMATAPNQVWSWDISYLKSLHKGIHYYLYVIIDIYSRYVVGWMIAENESSFSARRLMIETCQKQSINKKNINLHSDRGSVMKSLSKIKKLKEMGIDFSYSRPHVSNDNPFSESQFKTMKYSSKYPEKFDSLKSCISFGKEYFEWYNNEHHHTGINLLTPAQLHSGQALKVVDDRNALMQSVMEENRSRFVNGNFAKYSVPEAVWINPPATKTTGNHVG